MDNEEDAKRSGNVLLQYAVCINDEVKNSCPLIGRKEAELERTMQVLCRRQKNNPLHGGEPVWERRYHTYGLARINEGRVPE